MNDRLIENLEANLAFSQQELEDMEDDIKRGKNVPESQRQRLESNVKQIERKIKDAKNDPT